jgi:hypothetical protein
VVENIGLFESDKTHSISLGEVEVEGSRLSKVEAGVIEDSGFFEVEVVVGVEAGTGIGVAPCPPERLDRVELSLLHELKVRPNKTTATATSANNVLLFITLVIFYPSHSFAYSFYF